MQSQIRQGVGAPLDDRTHWLGIVELPFLSVLFDACWKGWPLGRGQRGWAVIVVPMTGTRTVLLQGCVLNKNLLLMRALHGEHVREHRGHTDVWRDLVCTYSMRVLLAGHGPSMQEVRSAEYRFHIWGLWILYNTHSRAPFPDLQQGAACKRQDSQWHPVTELLLSLDGLQSMQ